MAGPRASGIVFVVDDDPSVREGLSSLIRSEGWRVETFASATDFLSHPEPIEPSCLVLDVHLPGLSGLGLQARLQERTRPTAIVFISGQGDVPTSVRAMKAGAVDFFVKPFDDEVFLGAIRHALERDAGAIRHDADLHLLRQRYASLTPRQREVMRLVVDGRMNKEIAAALGITEVTVKIHRGRVMRTMDASSLPELVRMADRLNRDAGG